MSVVTNRFHAAVHLFSKRSKGMSKFGKIVSDSLACSSCAIFWFLPHFDVICDLLLNRRTATQNTYCASNNSAQNCTCTVIGKSHYYSHCVQIIIIKKTSPLACKELLFPISTLPPTAGGGGGCLPCLDEAFSFLLSTNQINRLNSLQVKSL